MCRRMPTTKINPQHLLQLKLYKITVQSGKGVARWVKGAPIVGHHGSGGVLTGARSDKAIWPRCRV